MTTSSEMISRQTLNKLPMFSVVTTTFNRVDTMRRLYESLCNQVLRDFEWVIVDDGSTDATGEAVRLWRSEGTIDIRYFWQENTHKKIAFDNGVHEAVGEWVLPIDSDDALTRDALRDLAEEVKALPPRWIGVTGLPVRSNGTVVGDQFPRSPLDCTELDMRYRYHVRGEKCGCLRRSVLLRFLTPVDVVGFVPELILTYSIALAGYRVRYVNRVFRIYYDSTDSMSRSGRKDRYKVSLSGWIGSCFTVDKCTKWFRFSPFLFVMEAARYTRYRLQMRASGMRRPAGWGLTHFSSRLIVAVAYPLGLLLYCREVALRLRACPGAGDR